MHKLLRRRIERLLGGQVPAGLEPLLHALSEDYEQSDRDRLLLERSLELTSQELLAANQRLRDDLRLQDAEATAIKGQRREFRELIFALPIGVLVRRGEHIVLANEALLSALGRTEASLKESSFLSLIHPDDRERARARMVHFDRTGEPDARGETRWVKASGETVFLELELAREIRLEGAPALMMVLRNVTDLKSMHARLAVADRMVSVGTMAAGVAHEINNPLSFIASNLEFVSDELSTGPLGPSALEELQQALRDARLGAHRVREIVRDLKTFTRISDGSPVLCDVEDIVESAVKLAWNEVRHTAQLERDYRRVGTIRADPGRLGQVFINLLVNAAQAMRPGAGLGRIALRIGEEAQRVFVEVRDSGLGMSPDQLGRIFDPFYTTKPVGMGTGLGLSICHGIVTQLGGTLEVESTVGVGSMFRVSLPVAYSTSQTPAPRLPVPPRAQSLRLLIIDDDELVGRSLMRTLGGKHRVEYLVSASEALARLQASPTRYDVILCDVMMPELGGEDFLLRLAALVPGLESRVIFMTGGAFTASAQRFLETALWLEKPVERVRLEELVARAVSAPKPMG